MTKLMCVRAHVCACVRMRYGQSPSTIIIQFLLFAVLFYSFVFSESPPSLLHDRDQPSLALYRGCRI